MKVSVVIPSANQRPAELLRAIQSVIDQRPCAHVDEVDIVVSNNASTSLPSTVSDLARQGVVRIADASQTRGVSHARNAGVRSSHGDTIAFLDDDDWWLDTYLEEMCGAMLQSRSDLVYCKHLNWLGAGPLVDGKGAGPRLSIAELFVGNPGITGSNMVVSRRVFEHLGGFNERLWASNDKDFLIRFVLSGHTSHGLDRRLTVVDQSVHERIGWLSQDKIDSLRVFYDLHANKVDEVTRAEVRLKIDLWEAMHTSSVVGLCGLWLRHPRKTRKLLRALQNTLRAGPIEL